MKEANERCAVKRSADSRGLKETAEVVESEPIHLDAKGANAPKKLLLRNGILGVLCVLKKRLEARGILWCVRFHWSG